MGTNRKLKTDGNLEIESNQVDINSDIDVSGDVGATTVTTTGLATLAGLAYPTSDGTADQVLTTNGSGTLSFADASGGGVDTIASASEALSYTGTNRTIYITATEAVVFTTDLNSRVIIMKEEQDLTFRNANVTNCIIQHYDDVIFDITTTDGTDYNVIGNTIHCFGGIKFLDNSNTAGNIFQISNNSFKCITFEFSNMNTLGYSIQNSSIHCFIFKTSGTYTSGYQALVYQGTIVRAENIEGIIKVGSGGYVNCFQGSGSNNIKLTDSSDNVLINSAYSYPFKANENSVDTKVIFRATLSANVSMSGTGDNKLTYDTETFDNTASYTSGTFTAKVKGFYKVNASSIGYAVGTSSSYRMLIYKGNPVAEYFETYGTTTTSNETINQAHISEIVELNVGDNLEIYVASSDSAYTIDDVGSSLNIEKIN